MLDLPDDDGDQSDDPARCSTAALYRRFSGEFRKLADKPGFELDPAGEGSAEAGFVRFRTTRKLATEFLLRKDYRADFMLEHARDNYRRRSAGEVFQDSNVHVSVEAIR